MTFHYTYRTPDGAWHEDRISAPDKPAVYNTLKSRGIRPVKVWCPDPPRFVLSKRWIAIAALAIALAASLAFSLTRPAPAPDSDAAAALPRHRITSAPSDLTARIPSLFKFSSERFLALHAQPGILFSLPDSSQSSLPPIDDLSAAVAHDVPVLPDDPEWAAELKRTVAGMKAEAAILLKNGKKPADIALWLVERQKMEAAYRNLIMSAPGTLDEKARKLRAMGL